MYAFFCYYVSIYKLAFTFKKIKILKKIYLQIHYL